MDHSLRRLGLRLVCLLAIAVPALPASAASAATGDPAGNRTQSSEAQSACAQDSAGSACITAALADINAAHAAEGVQPMVLPSSFASMSVPEQLLNLADLERVDRGMAPILGLAAPLNQDAQTAAEQNNDPMPSHFYGTVATGNWAAGYDSTLEADFAWMYDDGLGSDNVDCTSSDQSGCWGHRHDILWHFDTPIAMGAGYAVGQYGPSMTELFVGGDSRTGSGQPDAPVVRPSVASGAGSGSSGAVTGHAAGTGSHRAPPHGWVGPVVRGPRGVHVTVGCNGSSGRCKVTLRLGGGPNRAVSVTKTVWVAAGHRKTVFIALSRRARRLLRTGRKLHAHLVVGQGAKVLLSRMMTFRRS